MRGGGHTNFGQHRPLSSHSTGSDGRDAGRRTVSPIRGDMCEPSNPDHRLEDHGCRPRSPTGHPSPRSPRSRGRSRTGSGMEPRSPAATHHCRGKTGQPHQSPQCESTDEPRRHPRNGKHARWLAERLAPRRPGRQSGSLPRARRPPHLQPHRTHHTGRNPTNIIRVRSVCVRGGTCALTTRLVLDDAG
jgi:hypothetical protein